MQMGLALPLMLAASVMIASIFTMRHMRGRKTGGLVLGAFAAGLALLFFLRNMAQVLGEQCGRSPFPRGLGTAHSRNTVRHRHSAATRGRMMSRLTFATLCLAAAPALGRISDWARPQPFWKPTRPIRTITAPALAPTVWQQRAAE